MRNILPVLYTNYGFFPLFASAKKANICFSLYVYSVFLLVVLWNVV